MVWDNELKFGTGITYLLTFGHANFDRNRSNGSDIIEILIFLKWSPKFCLVQKIEKSFWLGNGLRYWVKIWCRPQVPIKHESY